jgi:protein-tyrosine phosphatase
MTLCTANVCRSRLAEGFLVAIAAKRDLPLTVVSAGTIPSGLEVPIEVREVLSNVRGLALDRLDLDRVGREVETADLDDSDLVLCMARAHVRDAVVREPPVWPRCFTLKELVRRGSNVGPRRGQPIESWLARVHEGRDSATLLGDSEDDDVADPYGGTREEYQVAATEISGLIDRLVGLVWP